jgi:GNAT superfamily N-acetyltransferase
MAAYRLRRAGPEDAPLLSRLKIATFRLTYRGIMPDSLLDGLNAADAHVGVAGWRRMLADPANVVHVIETGEPAGFTAVVPAPPPMAPARSLLDQLYLLPSWQGAGLGYRVWREVTEHIRDHSGMPFVLAVIDGNDRARRFYERQGGRQIARQHFLDWEGRAFFESLYRFG